MSQALYEEYKEALRRGHVAALRGRLDVAEAAYRAAAAIAPDRALPYGSLGAGLRRAGGGARVRPGGGGGGGPAPLRRARAGAGARGARGGPRRASRGCRWGGAA